MKRFYEIMKECNMDSIRHYFKKICHLNKKDLKIYMDWYNKFLKIEPERIDNIIFIKEDKSFNDIFYIQSMNPSDIEKLSHNSLMDLFSFELLGMYVYDDFKMKKEEFIVRCINENTELGLYDIKIQEALNKIRKEKCSYNVLELPLDGTCNAKGWMFHFIKVDRNSEGTLVLPIHYVDDSSFNTFVYYQIGTYDFTDNCLSIPIKKLEGFSEAYALLDKYNLDVCLLKDKRKEKLFVIKRDKYNSCNMNNRSVI